MAWSISFASTLRSSPASQHRSTPSRNYPTTSANHWTFRLSGQRNTTKLSRASRRPSHHSLSSPSQTSPNRSRYTLTPAAPHSALSSPRTMTKAIREQLEFGYASRTLTDVETRYSAIETECLAAIWACEAFRHYLHGHHFNLYSDHQALKFLMGGGASRSTNRKHHRWLAELQSYNFTICHRPGVDNVVPDALSRCYSLKASDRQAYLAALLVATLDTLDYTLHHRPISIAGFTISNDTVDDEMPTATAATLAATLAACLARGYDSALQQPAPSDENIIIADGPQELATILSAPFAVTPVSSAYIGATILVPEPSRFLNTSHNDWIQYLDSYTPVPLPHCDTQKATAHLAVVRHNRSPSRHVSAPVDLPQIDTTIVPLPSTKPVHCMELCGGLGVFLEALLRNGYFISRYTYCDSDHVAWSAMNYRLDCLHCRYPRQLPVSAYLSCHILPQDVHRITPDHLAELPPVDFFAAGPPCQNFSKAGPRLGWKGRTSRVFPAVLSILHQLMQKNRLTYVIENVPVAASGFPELTHALGQPVTGDAVNHGSAAHRRTAFWTNMTSQHQLQQHLDTPSVTPRWDARTFLRDMQLPHCQHWTAHDAMPEFFNKFVRTHGSHAHRPGPDGSPGPSQVIFRGHPVELPPILRAAAMGFDPWDTMPPGITTKEHHELLGNAIDMNLATHLLRCPTARAVCCGSCTLQTQCQFEGRPLRLRPLRCHIPTDPSSTCRRGQHHSCAAAMARGAVLHLQGRRWRGQHGRVQRLRPHATPPLSFTSPSDGALRRILLSRLRPQGHLLYSGIVHAPHATPVPRQRPLHGHRPPGLRP